MNKTTLQIILLIVGGIIVSLFFLLCKISYDNKKLKKEIKTMKEANNYIQSRYFDLEEMVLKKIKYENIKMPPSTHIRNEKGDSINISVFVHNNNDKIFFRFSERNCFSCVLSFNSILQQDSVRLQKNSIVYIADYETSNKIEYYKKMLNIEGELFLASDLNIPIEYEETPYLFAISKDLSINKLFFPLPDNIRLSGKYIENIKLQSGK